MQFLFVFLLCFIPSTLCFNVVSLGHSPSAPSVLTQLDVIRSYYNDQILLSLPGQETILDRSFSPDELEVGSYLLSLKQHYVDVSRPKRNTTEVPPPFLINRPFSQWRDLILDHELFLALKSFPKGVTLHVHNGAAINMSFIVEIVCARDDYYIYIPPSPDVAEYLPYSFAPFPSPPSERYWYSASQLYKELGPKFVDEFLSYLLMLPKFESGTPVQRWVPFQHVFDRSGLDYVPIMKLLFEEMSNRFAADGVQSVEIRAGIGSWLNESFLPVSPQEQLMMMMEWNRESISRLSGFGWKGFRIIHQTVRLDTKEKMDEALALSVELQCDSTFSDFVVAFDIAGEEDPGFLDRYYWDGLTNAIQTAETKHDCVRPFRMNLHAGESDWVTVNVIDAIVLGSKRLGHAFDLYRTKFLLEKAKRDNIGIEVCPISNFLLGYVSDFRLHPAIHYLNQHLLVSINPDDPGIFGYDGVTHDFFAAVLGMFHSSPQGIIGALKKVAVSSIVSSLMSGEEKEEMLVEWNHMYMKWIDRMLVDMSHK